jgi:hypothetical protein
MSWTRPSGIAGSEMAVEWPIKDETTALCRKLKSSEHRRLPIVDRGIICSGGSRWSRQSRAEGCGALKAV